MKEWTGIHRLSINCKLENFPSRIHEVSDTDSETRIACRLSFYPTRVTPAVDYPKTGGPHTQTPHFPISTTTQSRSIRTHICLYACICCALQIMCQFSLYSRVHSVYSAFLLFWYHFSASTGQNYTNCSSDRPRWIEWSTHGMVNKTPFGGGEEGGFVFLFFLFVSFFGRQNIKAQ
jgi:hypothetical protein